MTNHKIAAAVALALGTGGVAHATAPTAAECANPNEQVYVAGSSAAQNAFFTAVNTDFLGGNGSLYVSSNGNFKAICGISSNSAVAPTNTSILLHYRAEGGSVVGALPIAAPGTHNLNFLNTSGVTTVGTLTAPVTLTTTGTSSTVGTTDGWGGAVVKHAVDIGITDLEPAQLVGANYPSLYSTTVFGSATPAQLAGLASSKQKPLVDQVFGIFVNTNGFSGGGTGQAVNLSKDAVANILDGTFSDWSQVPTLTGSTVSTVAAPITVENREAGSGSRAQASIYFLDYNCAQSTTVIADPSPASDYYATQDALNAASSTAGAITYASIDNNTTSKAPNLSLASLNTVTATNLHATSGDYGDWYEAQSIKGNTTLDTVGTAVYNYIVSTLPGVNKAPQAVDILAIPNVAGNTAPAGAVSGVGSTPIYINPYGRSAKSCGPPAYK